MEYLLCVIFLVLACYSIYARDLLIKYKYLQKTLSEKATCKNCLRQSLGIKSLCNYSHIANKRIRCSYKCGYCDYINGVEWDNDHYAYF